MEQEHIMNLIQVILDTPFLSDEEKSLLLQYIQEERFDDPDFVEAIQRLGQTAIPFAEVVADSISQTEQSLSENSDVSGNFSPEELQHKANDIIHAVNQFLERSKQLDAETDQEIEQLISSQAESFEIDSIRANLLSPKKISE